MTGDMNAREYSTQARASRETGRVARVMAGAARLAGDGQGRFLAPALLQSWPGIVHGGGLVALLDAAARALAPNATGPRRLEGRLTSSVPIETALDLEGHAEDGVATVSILERAQPLTAVGVERVDASPAAAVEPVPAEWTADGRAGSAMPRSDQCLACGAHNPIGLRLGLAFDDDGVWARFEPPAPWIADDGTIETALAPVILDEVAWWLGALVAREGGLTNRLAVTLLRPGFAVPGPVTAVGRFADVTPVDRRRSFWRTRSGLLAADGTLLAVASIVFRPGPEYSARQMPFFRARTDPAVFARMFPGYAG